MTRVLIVDDHPIVREGVTTVLEHERDIDVVGAAGTIDDGLRLAAKLHPDVVLLDLRLPDSSSFDGVASFVHEGRSIVVFTAYDTDDDVFRAIRGGARGYLLKGSPGRRSRRRFGRFTQASRTSVRGLRRSSSRTSPSRAAGQAC